jgi:Ser/Thr protein kinase RdoA (MazF antagonist)
VKIFDVLVRFSRARASALRARVAGAQKSRQLSVLLGAQAQDQSARDWEDPVGAERSLVDLSFPKLEAVKDPELMREVFQRHLQPLDGKTYEVRECRISYIHYRRAARCVLQYTLRLAESKAGRERTQWVTGAMYAGGRTRRIWEKLRRTEQGQEVPGASPAFAPFSYIPDLDMLMQVFPYDHRFPALRLLMSGPPPELEPLLLARFGAGDWRAEAWNVEPVRYRPDMRAALRLTAQARDASTGEVKERRFYAKIYRKKEEGERTYQVLRALWDKTSAGEAGFAVARPIAYQNGLQTLLQEEVPGTSLEDILRREEDEAIPAVRTAARALASLHLDDEVVAPRRLSLRDEIDALKRVRELLHWACPHMRAEIEEAVGAVVAGLEEVPYAPIHGDLKPAHILVDGDNVALIDLDKFAMADPIVDVANLLFLLPGMSAHPHLLRGVVARTFVKEYFAHVPDAWRARLPLHYAAALLKKAAFGFHQRQAPGGLDRVESMVEKAKDSLAGKVW